MKTEKTPFAAARVVRSDEAGARADRFIANLFPYLGYGSVQKFLRLGKIKCDGKKLRAADILTSGQTLTFFFPTNVNEEARASHTQRKTTFDPKLVAQLDAAVMFEDEDLLVVNKPQGLATQAGVKTRVSLDRLAIARAKGAYTPRLTHRLDQDTSGVIMLAKTRERAAFLTNAFRERLVEKTYLALVVGTPKAKKGLWDWDMGKDTGVRKEKMSVDALDAQSAQTRFEVLESQGGLTLLRLTPLTGRKHQIRVHCAHAGLPIVGDGKYGGAKAHPFDGRTSLCLHAYRLSFADEGEGARVFEAPLPPLFQEILTHCGFTHFPGNQTP